MEKAVFDTIRTYNGKLFKLEKHLDRLFKSAKAFEIKPKIRRHELALEIKKALKKKRLKSAKIRVTFQKIKPNYHILIEKINETTIRKNHKKGISTEILKIQKFKPEAKDKGFYFKAKKLMEKQQIKSKEPILVNRKGFVTEALTSNIFIVKKGKLITPKTGMLKGITREEIMRTANKHRIKINERMIREKELFEADEVFLTGTIKEITPVIKINNKIIGRGVPGQITKTLMQSFRQKTRKGHY